MRWTLRGLYVITDRRRYKGPGLLWALEAALRGGADVVQLREKDRPQDEVVELARQAREITSRYGVPLIVNDSPEAALEAGADGVHLGRDDPSVKRARRLLGDDAVIGVSCYGDLERAERAVAEGADYVVFGTPYPTPTKPGRKPTPLAVLREAARRFEVPVFAIGGITATNVRPVLETGVDGVAVVSAVFDAADPERAARELKEMVSEYAAR